MLSLHQVLVGHIGRVWHCAWSRDGIHIASCGEDKTVRIWSNDGSYFSCIAVLEECQSKTIRSCEWSPDGQMVASASFDGTVVIWQVQDTTFRCWDQIACLEGHENEVKSVSWSHDGHFLATCGRDKKIWLWERMLNGDFECIAMLEGHTQDVKFVHWNLFDNSLFSSGYDDSIKVWKEVNDDWICVATLQGHSSTVWGLATNVNSSIISCSDDRSIILWEGGLSWAKIDQVENLHLNAIYSVDWNTSSDIIITGGGDNAINICKLVQSNSERKLQNCTYMKDCHDGDINCVRWNPCVDNTLMSSSDDGTVKVWSFCDK
jgi:WD40 repeat protein